MSDCHRVHHHTAVLEAALAAAAGTGAEQGEDVLCHMTQQLIAG